jgi:NitT/TauT family transport system substrate-binding protein
MAIVGVASAGRVRAQGTDVIRVGAGQFESHGSVYYAQELGYFKRAGINVDVQVFSTGGAAVLAAVSGGALDIGVGNPLPLANALERNLHFVFVAPGYIFAASDPPGSMLVVAPSSPIRGGQDLNGKVVAGVAARGLDTLALFAWTDAHGGDSASLKFVELPQGAIAEAVAAGRVDAAAIAQPALGEALALRKVRPLGRPYDALGPRIMVAGMFATESWADAHGDAIVRFQQAINEGSAWARANPEKAAVVLTKYTKIVGTTVHEYHAQTLDPALLQPTLDAAFRYKFIAQPLRAERLIWGSRAQR